MFLFGTFSPLTWLFWILGLAAFVVEAWALIDAVRRPSAAFTAAGKQTKSLWLIILGVAAVIGLYGIVQVGGFAAGSILAVAAFVAAAVYLTDVRPKVRQTGNGGSSRQGPYGPW